VIYSSFIIQTHLRCSLILTKCLHSSCCRSSSHSFCDSCCLCPFIYRDKNQDLLYLMVTEQSQ